ncbi:VIT1/CCC1 transporter family protein [Microvirga yunnanensis]|uniref:VIT1/CCC1 transporter family protein n=1 Tax=Microvirga yunnanensis TaxID=2953740 RepID=UPI00359FD5B8
MPGEDPPQSTHPVSHGVQYLLVGKCLPDPIYGANDGIAMTLAVVSGVIRAAMPSAVILVLAFANLVTAGFFMGDSNVLSRRWDMIMIQSQRLPLRPPRHRDLPWLRHRAPRFVTRLPAALVRGRALRVRAGDAARRRPGTGCGLRYRQSRSQAYWLTDHPTAPHRRHGPVVRTCVVG